MEKGVIKIILHQAEYRRKLQPLLEFKDIANIENSIPKLSHK